MDDRPAPDGVTTPWVGLVGTFLAAALACGLLGACSAHRADPGQALVVDPQNTIVVGSQEAGRKPQIFGADTVLCALRGSRVRITGIHLHPGSRNLRLDGWGLHLQSGPAGGVPGTVAELHQEWGYDAPPVVARCPHPNGNLGIVLSLTHGAVGWSHGLDVSYRAANGTTGVVWTRIGYELCLRESKHCNRIDDRIFDYMDQRKPYSHPLN